mmetsp:Transcript_2158/g.3337  ORF Transcript_2158/g.3337 Transcript_2158/m.3337 type:complete len:321 (+) Transcript_2158:31-993(+)
MAGNIIVIKMSADNADSEKDMMMMFCCAGCGTPEVDDIKLKQCAACDLVRYCSDTCQKDHRLQHKNECKKRAAELRDEILFKQPESSHLGDCPICCLPLPLDPRNFLMNPCCTKTICIGCNFANQKREFQAGKKENLCPFCRTPLTTTDEGSELHLKKRAEANDPIGLFKMGDICCHRGEHERSIEYFTRAAGLGVAISHCVLANAYQNGQGVERDEKRAINHWEEAAIGGHPGARFNLGAIEEHNRRADGSQADRAVRHYIIAANLGHDGSLEQLKKLYPLGLVSKEDFAATLRAHKNVVDETKSKQREEAEAANFYSI